LSIIESSGDTNRSKQKSIEREREREREREKETTSTTHNEFGPLLITDVDVQRERPLLLSACEVMRSAYLIS
jgi:hypothetical protein